MRWHTDVVELQENVLRNAVVEHAFTLNQGVLLVVEGRRIVLEMLDQRAGLRPLVEHLGLALIDTTPPVHPRGPRNGVAWDCCLIQTERSSAGACLSHRSIGRRV